MIDVIRSIYNFAEPPKPKKKRAVFSDRVMNSRKRQELVLALIQDKPMHVPNIAKVLGCSPEVARLDVRSLIDRKLAKNHALERQSYFVKAL